MYDELVKRLRELHPEEFGDAWDFAFACQQAMHEAADAIDSMSEAYDKLSRHMDDLAALMPRWIPVTERLPDSGVCVFVTDGLEVGEGWLTEIINTKGHFLRWCAPTADIDIDWRPITHWMPLPEPPKEGE